MYIKYTIDSSENVQTPLVPTPSSSFLKKYLFIILGIIVLIISGLAIGVLFYNSNKPFQLVRQINQTITSTASSSAQQKVNPKIVSSPPSTMTLKVQVKSTSEGKIKDNLTVINSSAQEMGDVYYPQVYETYLTLSDIQGNQITPITIFRWSIPGQSGRYVLFILF